jgi:chromosome segregation and condensation protein ScpB
VLGTLIERKLIKIVGRKRSWAAVPLRHHARVLTRFGLNDLSDLPKVDDMSELLGFELPASVSEPEPQSPLPFEKTDGESIH